MRRRRRRSTRPRRRRTVSETWIPKTHLGKMIQEGQISSMEEIFVEGMKLREPEVADLLLPDLQEEVININQGYMSLTRLSGERLKKRRKQPRKKCLKKRFRSQRKEKHQSRPQNVPKNLGVQRK
jgi:hypothetical protein